MATVITRVSPSPAATGQPAKPALPLAVLSSSNAITVPAGVLAAFPGIDCFEVSVADGCIALSPFVPQTAADVRRMLDAQGITEQDISDAVAWARSQ